MKYGQEDNQDQYKFQNMMKAMNSRAKRATDDLFELGDRLTDKLKQETEEWQAKLGNASCVLKELDIIDQNENLDISGMVQSVERGDGENSQTNGSRNNTSRTAAPAPPSLILSQKLFSKNALGEKSGEESSCSSNAKKIPNARLA